MQNFRIRSVTDKTNTPIEKMIVETDDFEKVEVEAFMGNFDSPGDERIIGIADEGWFITLDNKTFQKVALSSATQGEAVIAAMKLHPHGGSR